MRNSKTRQPAQTLHEKIDLLSSALVHGTPECSSKMPVVPKTIRRVRQIWHENRFWCSQQLWNGFSDRTFKSCAENFYQVYTVHCFLDGTTFSCICALLSGKRQDTHALWSNLKSDAKTTVSVMMDFVRASLDSWLRREKFPQTEIKGCCFLFSQAMYRKILELGYAVHYREDKDFKLSIRLLTSFAFAPLLYVEEWYKIVIKSYQIPEDFKISSRIHLAERKTGIPHGARPGSRKMWIVCFRTNDHQPTTNIALEGFRRRFEAIWYRCQTQIFEAIQIQQSLHAFTFAVGKQSAREGGK